MDKKVSRLRRARSTRHKLTELGANRLTVYRSNRHIYAQILAPGGVRVLASASTLEPEVRQEMGNGGTKDAAAFIGRRIAERAKSAGIEKVSFDRSGFRFHGRVKALAEAAREAGLQF